MSIALTSRQKEMIEKMAWEGYSSRQIASCVGCGRSSACKYANGYLQSKGGGRPALSRKDVGRIMAFHKLGRSGAYIAKRVGVHKSTVNRYIAKYS